MPSFESLSDPSTHQVSPHEMRALRLALHDAAAAPPRLTLRISEAATMCGVSKETFEKYFLPDLRVVSAGSGPRRIRLVLLSDLRDLMEERGIRMLGRFDVADEDVFPRHQTRRLRRDDADS